MSKVVALGNAMIPEAKSSEIANILRSLADRADAGEFGSMAFCAVMANGSSYTSWHTERAHVYGTIGATHCMLADLIDNTRKED